MLGSSRPLRANFTLPPGESKARNEPSGRGHRNRVARRRFVLSPPRARRRPDEGKLIGASAVSDQPRASQAEGRNSVWMHESFSPVRRKAIALSTFFVVLLRGVLRAYTCNRGNKLHPPPGRVEGEERAFGVRAGEDFSGGQWEGLDVCSMLEERGT